MKIEAKAGGGVANLAITAETLGLSARSGSLELSVGKKSRCARDERSIVREKLVKGGAR